MKLCVCCWRVQIYWDGREIVMKRKEWNRKMALEQGKRVGKSNKEGKRGFFV